MLNNDKNYIKVEKEFLNSLPDTLILKDAITEMAKVFAQLSKINQRFTAGKLENYVLFHNEQRYGIYKNNEKYFLAEITKPKKTLGIMSDAGATKVAQILTGSRLEQMIIQGHSMAKYVGIHSKLSNSEKAFLETISAFENIALEKKSTASILDNFIKNIQKMKNERNSELKTQINEWNSETKKLKNEWNSETKKLKNEWNSEKMSLPEFRKEVKAAREKEIREDKERAAKVLAQSKWKISNLSPQNDPEIDQMYTLVSVTCNDGNASLMLRYETYKGGYPQLYDIEIVWHKVKAIWPYNVWPSGFSFVHKKKSFIGVSQIKEDENYNRVFRKIHFGTRPSYIYLFLFPFIWLDRHLLDIYDEWKQIMKNRRIINNEIYGPLERYRKKISRFFSKMTLQFDKGKKSTDYWKIVYQYPGELDYFPISYSGPLKRTVTTEARDNSHMHRLKRRLMAAKVFKVTTECSHWEKNFYKEKYSEISRNPDLPLARNLRGNVFLKFREIRYSKRAEVLASFNVRGLRETINSLDK